MRHIALCLKWVLEYLEENKMTLEEKIELLTVYAKDKKLVEVYDDNTQNWICKVFDIWDFEGGKYRIKSKIKPPKFKAGDALVCKTAENMLNPVKKVLDDEYVLESSTITDREVIEDMFVSERDILWYFEFYDYASKEYSLSSTRNTIEKADKDFAPYHDTSKWQPMYLLGFRLKEN